jgi:hypothetical protein
MKHLNKILIAVMMSDEFKLAQDGDNPWAVSFGVNAVSTRVSSGNSGLEADFLNHLLLKIIGMALRYLT